MSLPLDGFTVLDLARFTTDPIAVFCWHKRVPVSLRLSHSLAKHCAPEANAPRPAILLRY